MNPPRRTPRRGAPAPAPTTSPTRARGRGERAILTGLTALVMVPLVLIVTSPLWWVAAHTIRWAIS